MRWSTIFGLAIVPTALGNAPTDTLQDIDASGNGYLPNHNIDIGIASTFKKQWTMTYNAAEAFYAKPLVWTPPGATDEVVITTSNQNIIRILDGKTGATIKSRTLDPPFDHNDAACGDIPTTIGITGTPYIDPATDIMYFFSKSYRNGLPTGSGILNGIYRMFAVQLPSLNDVAGFPVLIEGNADNDPTRYFLPGTVLQRPSVAALGDSIIGSFGGHCDKWNYTGVLVTVSKTPGKGVTGMQAMMASPWAPSPQELDYTQEGGGKAGIWMGGMGPVVDSGTNSVYIVTGNGRGGGQNAGGVSASGKTYLSTLQQAVGKFTISPNGVLTQADWFEPYEYQNLNGGDQDFGSAGAVLLDPYFSGGGVRRVVVAGGKSGKIYIMDADNLGGFATGPGNTDGVLQTIQMPFSMLGGVANYPAEGGYIYFCPSGAGMYVYKYTPDGSGKPAFTFAGTGSAGVNCAGKATPVITTYKGQPGTAVVWMSDVNGGVYAYDAIPKNGALTKLPTGPSGRIQKGHRPVFGNARLYTTVANQVLAMGGTASPPALTCAPSPINFGNVILGQVSTLQVTCTAGTALTLKGCSTGLATFQCAGIPASVASGGTFTFSAIFNLTDAAVLQAKLATPSFIVVPGGETTALSIINTAGAAVTNLAVSGKVIAPGGFMVLSTINIDFGSVAVGASTTKSLTVTNQGSGVLTFKGLAFRDSKIVGSPFQNITFAGTSIIGNGFTSSAFPGVGSQVAAGASITVPMTFVPSFSGTLSSLVAFWTDGGYGEVLLVGSATGGPSSSSSLVATSTTSSKTLSSSLISTSSSSTFSPLSSSESLSIAVSSGSPSSSLFSSAVSTLESSSTADPYTSSSIESSSSTVKSSSFSSAVKSSSSSSSSSSTSSSSSSTFQSSSSSKPTSSSYSSIIQSSSSSRLSSTSSSATNGPSTNVAETTSTFVTVTKPTSTPTASGYPYIGCFKDTSKGHALPLLFKNNSMTPELCEAYVSSLASKPTPTILPYFYVEFARECYGGSSFTYGSSNIFSVTGAKACTKVCSGSIGAATTGTAKCGGSKQYNLYATNGVVNFPAAITTVSK